jgi:hypothetical protein
VRFDAVLKPMIDRATPQIIFEILSAAATSMSWI